LSRSSDRLIATFLLLSLPVPDVGGAGSGPLGRWQVSPLTIMAK
jgi:hypothetical protein